MPEYRGWDIRLDMPQTKAQCLVLGAGIIGSAVAYELSRRGVRDIHVLDPDLEGQFSSTERNAGGVRHLWRHPINVELARHSIALFEEIKEEIGFQQSGYLWLFKKEESQTADDLLAHTRSMGVAYEKLSPSDIKQRYPFLDKTEDLSCGMFGAKDGLLNANALKSYFRKEAQEKGVRFHDRFRALKISKHNGGVRVAGEVFPDQKEAHAYLQAPSDTVQFEKQEWSAEVVILCMGAWSQTVDFQEEEPLDLKPIRRQIALFQAEGFDMTPYGMVVDTSKVYFHPEGGNILAGFVIKDEKAGFNFSYDPNFFEEHLWPPLFERSTKLERLKHVTGWGGMYHYTPDTTGILGKVPGWDNLIEAHSFTGRGVMQCYGAALAVADLVLKKSFSRFDAACLSRTRFRDPKQWLAETLHI